MDVEGLVPGLAMKADEAVLVGRPLASGGNKMPKLC